MRKFIAMLVLALGLSFGAGPISEAFQEAGLASDVAVDVAQAVTPTCNAPLKLSASGKKCVLATAKTPKPTKKSRAARKAQSKKARAKKAAAKAKKARAAKKAAKAKKARAAKAAAKAKKARAKKGAAKAKKTRPARPAKCPKGQKRSADGKSCVPKVAPPTP